MTTETIIRSASRELACKQAALALVETLKGLLEKGSRAVTLGLCGGTSPLQIFPTLIGEISTWPAELLSRLNFVLIDERRVDLDSPDSNFNLLSQHLFQGLLSGGLVKAQQIHAFPVHLETAQACEVYTELVLKKLGGIDIAILGVGPDAHIAALFPNHCSVAHSGMQYIYIADRPKPPKEGFSASADLISSVGTVFLLFLGEEKQEALNKYLASEHYLSCPASLAKRAGKTFLVTDIV